jgi:hypothetical protein
VSACPEKVLEQGAVERLLSDVEPLKLLSHMPTGMLGLRTPAMQTARLTEMTFSELSGSFNTRNQCLGGSIGF